MIDNDRNALIKSVQKARDKQMAKLAAREAKIAARRAKVESSLMLSLAYHLAIFNDKYYIDPLIGWLFPGVGDVISIFFSIPFIYISLFQLHSIPLTLAVIYNFMVDILVGLFPILGNILDIFIKSYAKNLALIRGYIDGDEEIIHSVNKKALFMAILIVIVGVLIYLLVSCVISLIRSFFNLF